MRAAILALLLVPSLASAGDFCQFWAFVPPVNQANQVRQQVKPFIQDEYDGITPQVLNRAAQCMANIVEALRDEYFGQCMTNVVVSSRFTPTDASITGTVDEAGVLTADANADDNFTQITLLRQTTNSWVTNAFFNAFNFCVFSAFDYTENGPPDLVIDD